MKIKYKDYKPQSEALNIIHNAEKIIIDYSEDGYTLTLRQLYYQFVKENLLPNTQKSYDKLGKIISRARMAGMISWHAIEDKHRSASTASTTNDDIGEIINDCKWYVHVNHWDEQDCYIEVWVEKDALGNVIERACEKYDVPHMACKGYLSTSEAWAAGQRFEKAITNGNRCIVIHLGDHDASGIDMSRDNQKRLNLFTQSYNVELRRIALNMDQVEQYNPPPNPAKQTDPRAKAYIEKYGNVSWELDALKPQVLVDLIQNELEKYIDLNIWNQASEREENLRSEISEIASRMQNL